MAYACGDSYPQFQINKVYPSSAPMDRSVLGTNPKVIFSNGSMEYKMNDFTKSAIFALIMTSRVSYPKGGTMIFTD